jgi:predicted nucleic-acid-binding protein
MGTVFIDEGAFLSFLVRDDEVRFRGARMLFEGAEAGQKKLETNEFVLLEVARTLEKKYKMPREAVTEVLEAILGTRNLRVPGRRVLNLAVELYALGDMDFASAYNSSYAAERGLRHVIDVLKGVPA